MIKLAAGTEIQVGVGNKRSVFESGQKNATVFSKLDVWGGGDIVELTELT